MKTLLLLCFIISGLNLFAQNEKFFNTENALSNNLVNYIYQDRSNYIWIATEDGLNKFDGVRFTQYHYNKNNKKSIKGNHILTLIDDSNKHLWVGRNNGLAIYNRLTDEFDEIDFVDGQSKVYPYITSIIEITNTEMWISTSGYGLYSVNISDSIIYIKDRIETKIGVEDIEINCLFKDSSNYIWIATRSKGLYRYNIKSKQIDRFNLENGLLIEKVTAICEARDNMIFAASKKQGIFNINPLTKEIRLIQDSDKLNNIDIKTLLYRKSEDCIYVGTDGQGIKTIKIGENKIIDNTISTQHVDFSKMKVHSLLEDKDHNLWIGLFQKGILLMPLKTNTFDYYGYKSYYNNSIGSNCIISIYASNKAIWVGTDGDGLYSIDNNGKQLRHYQYKYNDSLSPPKTIMSIFQDSEGSLWLGSYRRGICKIDKKSGACSYLNDFDIKSKSLIVPDIIEDKNGNLWIGTLGDGIYVYNIKNKCIIDHINMTTSNNSLHNNWINVLKIDSDDKLWIGSHKGLGCYDLNSKSFINYDQQSFLNEKLIYAILESRNGLIWIGTSDGLYCFNKKSKKFNEFTSNDGLPNNVICGLEEDSKGDIWISTHKGLSMLNTEIKEFYNYYLDAGIQGYEFWYGSHTKTSTGKILFGGSNGISAFDPTLIQSEQRDVNVVISKLYVKGQEININSKSGSRQIINTDINDVKIINFSHFDNSFTLEFNALEYLEPERIVYRYKIDGVDTDWMTTNKGVNQASYTNLSPGKYYFHVQAINNDNKSEIKTIVIQIYYPWYLTIWALLIWIGLLISIIFCIAYLIIQRQNERKELKERERQNSISEAKLQFFTNISHEIRTPMTLIMNPLEKLLKLNSEHSSTYLLIYKNAQRILNIINELLDVRKIDNGKMKLHIKKTPITAFIHNITDLFLCQSQKDNIQLTVTYLGENEEIDAFIDPNNFDKVIFNLLSNAFKFTPAYGRISIQIKVNNRNNDEKWLQIQIIDNGKGIDNNDINKIFERYFQIENNLQDIGTGIGLNLCKLIVELHHGDISARNNIDKGCTFTINIPLEEKYFKNDGFNTVTNIRKLPIIINDNIDFNLNSPIEKNKIFIIDDEQELRNYIAQELSYHFHVTCFESGVQAISAIITEKPDLVLSDVLMPEMDGFQLCRKIKSNSNTNDIPVVLLTAKTMESDQLNGINCGADAYITKPFSTGILCYTITNIIRNRSIIKYKFSNEAMIETQIEPLSTKSNNTLFLERVNSVINKQLSDPNFNVDILALSVGVSRVHLYRKIKELTNQSVRNYIKDIRLKQAAILLKAGGINISEVAYKVGFNNTTYFSTLFREKYGLTPKDFSKQ